MIWDVNQMQKKEEVFRFQPCVLTVIVTQGAL